VTALVPTAWTYGSLQDWCANGGALEPRVERPGTLAFHIKCATSTYGLRFQTIPDDNGSFDWPVTLQASKGWPPNAWVGARGIDHVLVEVTGPTRQAAAEVLATVRAIGPEGDPNGCGPRLDGPAPAPPSPGGMSVCRYDAQGDLEQSEVLTGDGADSAEQALRAAPLDGRRGPYCSPPHAPTTTIRLVSSGVDATATFGGDCWSDTRVMLGGEARMLDADVLYWALSPGWSGDGTNLPLPPELRQQ
jgi:hypothetical protein